MSSYSQEKAQFRRDVVLTGVATLEELVALYPFGWNAGDVRLARWWRGLDRTPALTPFPEEPRLVNRFKLGADPEFIFADSESRARRDADTFKMRQGRAYGADNNGRLVEIRPKPARWALEVLGSIHSTLRWMALTVPETQKYRWEAGAFLQDDGLGGHVHFGRKRESLRPGETAALDVVERLLEAAGCYPVAECAARRKGDAHNQRYGQFGDIRKQAHGYEYRTFPSWLDSPWLAYFTLTLSKLAVYDPELLSKCAQTSRTLERVLQYFRGLDEDARLCLWALKRHGLPGHVGGNFRLRWGISNYPLEGLKGVVTYIPSGIAPDEGTIWELWSHLRYGTAIRTGVIPPLTWSPAKPPKGFKLLLDDTPTRGVKGLGELLTNVVIHEKDVPRFRVSGGPRDGGRGDAIQFILSKGLRLPKIGNKLPKGSYWWGGGYEGVIIPLAAREGQLAPSTKRLLTESGVFPFWRIEDASEAKRNAWVASCVDSEQWETRKVGRMEKQI